MRFGPIGIAAKERNNGIGSVLLDLYCFEMSRRGIYRMSGTGTERFAGLGTEAVNHRTEHIDEMGTREALEAINDLDQEVAPAVRRSIPDIARIVDGAHERMLRGGRLIYMVSSSVTPSWSRHEGCQPRARSARAARYGLR